MNNIFKIWKMWCQACGLLIISFVVSTPFWYLMHLPSSLYLSANLHENSLVAIKFENKQESYNSENRKWFLGKSFDSNRKMKLTYIHSFF